LPVSIRQLIDNVSLTLLLGITQNANLPYINSNYFVVRMTFNPRLSVVLQVELHHYLGRHEVHEGVSLVLVGLRL
jgi:hypothetical protein